ncbi:hypothetical protein [Desertihabitans aurantiacus]|nr:hypothetical protein [Desertihabitans aurantiacus]
MARAGYRYVRGPLQVRVDTSGGTSPELPERITEIRVSAVATG